MGWFAFAFTQVVITSTLLGALKSKGAIQYVCDVGLLYICTHKDNRINASAIKNDSVRRVFVMSVRQHWGPCDVVHDAP